MSTHSHPDLPAEHEGGLGVEHPVGDGGHSGHDEHAGGDGHAGHGGHGGHKKGHGGDHGGGGGHGGSWIVTYSDMITLLMAFFICIITFSSKEKENYGPKKDSLMGNAGGSGIASKEMKPTLEQDSIIWRLRIARARVSEHGAEMAPVYQDPSLHTSAQILQALEEAAPGRLHDDFAIRLPLSLLFEKGEQLSSSGVRILHALAVNLRDLPYDLQFQTARDDQTGRAVRLCTYLSSQEGYEPARLAVGARPPRPADGDALWLVLARQF
jgi:hypothetical protein